MGVDAKTGRFLWRYTQTSAGPANIAMPIAKVGGDRRALDADILIAPEAYREFLRGTSTSHYPLRYTWRYYVDPERLDSTTIGALLVDLRRAQATFPGANVGFNQETAMRGSLLPLVERAAAGLAGGRIDPDGRRDRAGGGRGGRPRAS